MRPMKRISLVFSCALLLIAAPGDSQTAESLKGAFDREAQLLDEAIDDFGRSRTHERNAIDHLRQLSTQLDDALSDPNVSLDYLSNLEAQLAASRDRACTSLEQTAQARQKMYDRMERVAAVAREFEEKTDLFGRAQEGISGMWHLEVQPLDLYGLMNLRLQGAQVSGPYRLSNGRQGSLNGTLSGDSLTLQAIDAETGRPVATIEARIDATAGQIIGEWTAMDLSQGLPSMGDWLADKVSSQEEIDLDY